MSFNTDSKPLSGSARRLRSADASVPPPDDQRPYPRALVAIGVVLFCGTAWTLIFIVAARLLHH